MKITEIHIASFGGLKNKTVTLEDGFNIIYGDNEAGKTTLITFLRAIFYGAGDNRGNDLSKKLREKYTPWSGEPMMGSVTFEHGGGKFRLERTFGKSDKYDSSVLFNLSLGTQEKVSGSLGEKYFGVGVDAFSRCFFIESGGKIEHGDGGLNKKLSSIVQTGDEDISLDIVIKNLAKGKELLISKSGRKGSLIDDRANRSRLLAELRDAENSEEQLDALVNRGLDAETKLRAYETRRGELSALLDKRSEIEIIKKRRMLADKRALLQRSDEMLTCRDGSMITEDTVADLRAAFDERKALRLQISDIGSRRSTASIQLGILEIDGKSDETDAIKHRIDELGEEKRRVQDEINLRSTRIMRAGAAAAASKGRKKPISVPLLIPALVLAAAGAITFVLSFTHAGIALLCLAAIFLILSFLLRPADKAAAEAAENELTALEAKQHESQSRLSDIEDRIRAEEDELDRVRADFDKDKVKLEGEIESLEERLSKLNGQLADSESRAENMLLSVCGEGTIDDIPAIAERLYGLLGERRELEAQIKLLGEQIGDGATEPGADEDTLRELEQIDFDDVSSEATQLDTEINAMREIAISAKTELRTRSKSFISPETIKKQLTAIEERISEKEEFIAASELASSILEESYAELRSSYGAVIEKKTIDIFSRLTGGRYKSVTVSDSFDICAEQSGFFGTREIGYLSTGTADQAYLSVRLAVAELISGEHSVPIMMDDTLSQYDDTRTSRALDFLAEYAKHTQIMLFTCHGHLRDEGRKAGADIIYL